ncbi:response regulator [Derxia gummosa]|uniref:Response regulator n=1 Tax=Derxia gummosa DSM 723 TaxID=1121388 RepID=A0A8B6X134_9BURK|nr:response regulator [Derxia gummosa]
MPDSRHALVVDDNQMNRKLAIAFLKRLNWTADEAQSGSEALNRVQEGKYDAVLLDLRMPVMSGESVCRAIRSEPRFAHLPVIAYTAHAMIEEKQQILGVGFNALLIKPTSFSDFKAVFETL